MIKITKNYGQKSGLILCFAAALGGMSPLCAWASSPEFAREASEWETLRDNTLMYEEIADLIHEYNITVQNNQYSYNKFIQDYGRTKDDVAREYRDLADELESDQSGGDSAMEKISDLQLQLQADSLREQADDNLEDSYIYYLNYSQTEDNLVLSAQCKMISYYRTGLELESAKEQKEILEDAYNQNILRYQAGTITQAEVLDAQEAILTQEKYIVSLETEMENTRQGFIVMLGWSSSDQPEISDLPKVELEEINRIDLEGDKALAIENNYTLKTNERKLQNAETEATREDLRKTIEANKKQIETSVNSSYQNLLLSRDSYEEALAELETERRNTSLAELKWQAGTMTADELKQQQYTLKENERAEKAAAMDLLETWETYAWDIKGLASAE